MNLANQIIKLRKSRGWSQEELADQLDVSRQSVSKWESSQSTPDLDKIAKLSEIFGVTTDFLIKNVSPAPVSTEDTKNLNRVVSLSESTTYINAKISSSKTVVKGIALCVCSPMVLILLLGLMSSEAVGISKANAVAIGIISLLLCVAVAISFFVRAGQDKAEFAEIEHQPFSISSATKATLKQQRDALKSSNTKRMSLGIALFVLAIVPLLSMALIFGRVDLTLYGVVLIFPTISAGLALVIPASTQTEAYQRLILEGDLDAGKSEETKNAEKLGAFYWPLLVAIYFAWSFWTQDWGTTWIVWPVAGVAFAALVGLMGLIKKKQNS